MANPTTATDTDKRDVAANMRSEKSIDTPLELETAQVAALTDHEREIEKKIVKRIDWIILPIIVTVYLLNWIDRNNYAAARLAGLEKDLNMSLTQFQTGLSIMFVGYILGQIPANLMLNWFGRPSWFLGFFTIAWGLVSAMTALVHNFAGIVVCRLILGFVEAPFFPGVIFYLSKWYTKKELNLRMSIFYSGSLIAGAFGPLIAAGILDGLDGVRGLAPWRWLYIIEGVCTIVAGIILGLFLPDFPNNWRALTPEMQHVAVRRMALEAAEEDLDDGSANAQIRGLKLALGDKNVWVLTAMYMCVTAAQGFNYYFPTLTRTLGYSRFVSLILVAPPYVFMTFWSCAHGLVSDRYTSRFWFCIYPLGFALVGFVLFISTNIFGPKYLSFFLMIFLMTINGTLLSWTAATVARPPAKRAAAYAIINSLGNSVSIWTPFTYLDREAPFFYTGMGICIGLVVIGAAAMVLLRFMLNRENKRLDRLQNEDNVPLSAKDLARLQKTADAEGVTVEEARTLHKEFRYTL